MKIMRLGDPHVKHSNIEESDRLMQFVVEECHSNNINRLEILGDVFDTHSIIRLEVLEFWQEWFEFLKQQSFQTVVLVGNHDITGNYESNYSALHPFISLESKNFKIVNKPHLDGLYGYLPYIHDNNRFVEESNKLAEGGATVIVSHPNYEGAVYDNGASINNGVNPDLINHRVHHLIGGHIHTELELGRVWYTGNARWLTKSCANKRKGIWLCSHNDSTGKIESKQFISTENVCNPIVSIKWLEGEPKPAVAENARVDIELVGSSDWISGAKKEFSGVSISTKITDIKKSRERKAGRNLYEFLSKYYDSDKKDKLLKYMENLNLV
jgi:hypothetical protein